MEGAPSSTKGTQAIKEVIMEKVSRRQFLNTAVGATAALSGLLHGTYSFAQEGEPLKMGVIGCGWYGMVDAQAALKVGGVEIIALCDVDDQHLQDSAKQIETRQGKRPAVFKDYQKLLALEELQAVIIATPPQWHALIFLAALERGLDIYAEKPLAYDIREGQVMLAAAKKSKQIVQVGFQRRQSPAIREARDYVQQGQLGRVQQAEVQIHYTAEIRDTTVQDPPASLDWDLWCGPAPKLPYCPNIGHYAWRLEKAYGNGHLVDWGIHLIDATRWILNETMPQSVQASGGIYVLKDKITTPDLLHVQFEFDTCPVTWRHRIWGAREVRPELSNGIALYGEKGTLFVTDDRWEIIPKSRRAQSEVKQARSDMAAAHMEDFLTAVKTRQQPLVTPEEGFRSSSTVQLAMIAYEVGEKLRWDAPAQSIIDNPRAQAMMKREYRASWKHPYQG
jgi:predicted dehydrogenase